MSDDIRDTPYGPGDFEPIKREDSADDWQVVKQVPLVLLALPFLLIAMVARSAARKMRLIK